MGLDLVLGCISLSIILFLSLCYFTERLILREKEKKKKLLVILDLNGLIVHRHHVREPLGDQLKAVSHMAHLVGQHYTWDRPHRESFLDFLFDNFTVAVWSSAMAHNVDLLVGSIFGPERRKQLLFEFDQSYCEEVRPHPDPKETKKPLFKKNLSVVWLAFPEYDETNTLLVDDSEWKTVGNPARTTVKVESWVPREDDEDDGLSENGYIRSKLKLFLH